MRTLEQLFSTPSDKNSPVTISEKELELIEKVVRQPLEEPLQPVGQGKVRFLGFDDDPRAGVFCIRFRYVDTQKEGEFFYRLEQPKPEASRPPGK